MNEFLQFNIGQVAQTIVFVAGVVGLYFQLRSDVKGQNDRLDRIEIEVISFRKFFEASARLEERIEGLRQVVTQQGKRLDWMTRQFYGKRYTEDPDEEDNR